MIGYIFVQLDSTTGSTMDWARKAGVKYSFTPELRGGWFEVDPEEISKSLQEFTSGAIKMAEAVEEAENTGSKP